MRPCALIAIAFCAALGACAETPTAFQATAGATLPAGVSDVAPASFAQTCLHSPDLCAAAPLVRGVDGAAPAVTAASPAAPGPPPSGEEPLDDRAALRLLQSVNSGVNGAMARDSALWVNARDEWAPASMTPVGLVGDCKSFAAEKRRRLIEAGFPRDRLFYAVVFRADIGLHALLMARLSRGDYALDSRQPWVTPWYEAAYTYVQKQSLDDPMRWSNLIAPDSDASGAVLLADNHDAQRSAATGFR